MIKKIIITALLLPLLSYSQMNVNKVEISINGNAVIQCNGFLKLGDNSNLSKGGNLILKGDLQNDNTNNAQHNVALTLNGTSKQTIKGNSFSCDYLSIQNPNNIYSAAQIGIGQELDLSKGVLEVNQSEKLVLAHSTKIKNANYTSYIDATVRRGLDTHEEFIFPVGDINYGYAPVLLRGPDYQEIFDVKFKGEGQPGSTLMESNVNSISNTEYWNVTPLNPLTSDVKIGLSWSFKTKQTKNLKEIGIGVFDGVKWQSIEANTLSGTTSHGSITHYSTKILGDLVLSNAIYVDPNILTSAMYYQLQPKLQADYAYVETNKVFFLFHTPYTLAPDTKLNFKIYNSKRVLMFDQNSVNIPVKYGLNKLNIDVTTLVNGKYVLEVINSIGETQFLTFVK